MFFVAVDKDDSEDIKPEIDQLSPIKASPSSLNPQPSTPAVLVQQPQLNQLSSNHPLQQQQLVPRPILIEPAAPSTATAGPPTNVTVAAPAALSRVLQSQNSQDEASTDSDTVSNWNEDKKKTFKRVKVSQHIFSQLTRCLSLDFLSYAFSLSLDFYEFKGKLPNMFLDF